MYNLSRRMRFGVFVGPFHRLGVNPTLAMRRDIELAEHLDNLGYDEIWYGEHHSGGVETVSSPELMIAAAAERTKHIKLGTGVSSLPYHHPLMTADRIVQLDHMTRGRTIFGVGPGQLVADATMIGADPSQLRTRMEESLDVILRLLAGETVTAKTDWFTLQDAVLQLPLFSDIEVAVTAVISASGPSLAGRVGASLLSLAAADPVGAQWLAKHWEILETESAHHGHMPDRNRWRLVSPVYIAETLEQAKKDVAYGMPWLLEYLSHITPNALGAFDDVDKLVDTINESGRGVVGTPEMAVEQINRLQKTSGGFGTFLLVGADYARWPHMLQSFELFAEQVMPQVNGQLEPLQAAVDRVYDSGNVGAETTARSQALADQRYNSTLKDRVEAPGDA